MTEQSYLVEVREVHVSTRRIVASSPSEAILKVSDGEGEELLCEYSHTEDTDTWSVKLESEYPASIKAKIKEMLQGRV